MRLVKPAESPLIDRYLSWMLAQDERARRLYRRDQRALALRFQNAASAFRQAAFRSAGIFSGREVHRGIGRALDCEGYIEKVREMLAGARQAQERATLLGSRLP